MGWIDSELALIALAAMLSPTTLSFSVLALVLSDRPKRTGLWFYLGALSATLAIGVLAAFVLGDIAASETPSQPKTWVCIVDIIAAVVLVVYVIRGLRRPPDPQRIEGMMTQMTKVAGSPVIAIIGAGAALANPGGFIPLALKDISETNPTTTQYIVDWLFFTLVSLLPLAVALVLLAVAPERATRVLRAALRLADPRRPADRGGHRLPPRGVVGPQRHLGTHETDRVRRREHRETGEVMSYEDSTTPTRVEARLESMFPSYNFRAVLVLLLATFVVMASGPSDAWSRVLTVTLQSLTLLAALLAARSGRRLFRIAAAVTVTAVASSILSVIVSSSSGPTGIYFGLNVLLVGAAPVAIAVSLYRRAIIDIRTVLGAICIYILLGMMFAFLYASVNELASDPFFVQTAHARHCRTSSISASSPRPLSGTATSPRRRTSGAASRCWTR